MTAIKEVPFKELTVKQYEFYKRKGLSDERIMKMHGYNVNTLNAWKKTNDLIGVKFEKDVKVTSASSSSVESEPVDESKPTEFATNLNAFLVPDSNDNGTIGGVPSFEPEAPPSTDWFNARHIRDTETIGKLERRVRELEKERYAEIERGDNWRNKYSFTDNEMEKREIENRNLKFEIEKLNQLLEKAHANDKLMDGVMRLYLDTKGKLIDSVDGEVSDKWR